ncbi:UNVERIFIED_CONTAM: Retrovirus-related Pol polyprotein from transposon TNT 1-94 [Sesamum calycinum]|uniref:Retrovirus-related Pol polyprotein from transposon TNT 1-94 n=1 Tax=Sesamum calycinum TaxID=2727403 RepID=A0AAW2Q2M5_9LAMI
MTKGFSVQEHGVKILSLVGKLEGLKVGLENGTYIDVILQSLPPSYDPFVINFNMNGLEKSINELINMLVQYEATIKKSTPSVLIGEALTSKTKGKKAGHWKRKKGKAKAKTVIVAKDTKSSPITPVGMGKRKKRMGMFVVEVNMVTNSASWVLDTDCGAHICNDLQVLQRSRKLSKDEVVLRFGDGKVVTAEAVGIISLVIWHARLGHISQDRMKGLVDSQSLEIDNLDNLPAFESFLRGKMTRKPFVGQSKLANGLLDLIHTDVCGALNTHTRGLKWRNQTGRKIKTLRSDRGGEYLSGEFIDYLKKKGIVSQWTPPGTPQLNGVAERRNRTLLDIIRSMMNFTELSLSFWGYALETAARLLNSHIQDSGPDANLDMAWQAFPTSYPKETAGYYFYDPSEQKVFVSRNAVFLERGFPKDTRRDELLLEESSEAPQSNAGTLSAPTVFH